MLKEEKYKVVPKNYKGVVRVKPSKAYPSRYWHVYAKLERGYRYTGNPGHSYEQAFTIIEDYVARYYNPR